MNYVLLSIHIYWAHIYIIPKTVLFEINQICRAYLWHVDQYSLKPGNLAWEKVCYYKKSWGLRLEISKFGIKLP